MQNRNYTKGRKQICVGEIINIPFKCRERFLSLDAAHLLPLAETGICFSGIGVLASGYRIQRFDPSWHSLIYTFEGSGKLETEGKVYDLYPGSLYIAPAHCPHEYWIKKTPWNIAWFCMEEGNGFHCAPEEPMVLVSSSGNLVSSIIEKLVDAQGNVDHSPEVLEYTAHLLMTILRRDTESARASKEQLQKQRLDSAFAEVRRDPSFNWTVLALIEKGHLPFGEDRFRQLCVEVYEQTPMKRVKAIRMQIAQELLKATDYPLRTIAPMVGYSNEFAFSTAFHKELGVSPQEFRKSD